MKIYVAFRTDVDPPTRIANGSFTTIKKLMKEEGSGAEFTLALYDFKPSLVNMCQAIMDVTEIGAESAIDYHVTDKGHLREVK
jgi:hypothetical protein